MTTNTSNDSCIDINETAGEVSLLCPVKMPRAAGFLWNKHMMIQMNCRGFAIAQFMQPEPAKYAYAPNLEAKTFMQPEQPYYAHHPGRFFYIKDEETGELFSAPYEPVRTKHDEYRFTQSQSDIRWHVKHLGIEINLQLNLPEDDVVELWQLRVKNTSGRARNISVYPYFPIGYMSWMNQSGDYSEPLGGVVGRCVTPYQKVDDYFKNKNFKDLTFFLHDQKPNAYECNRERFEGEGGLHQPDAIMQASLDNGDAIYETPIGAFQYQLSLDDQQQAEYRFLFGPAKDDAEIALKRERYFSDANFANAIACYQAYVAKGQGCIEISTPDAHLNQFVNKWLPRQMFYHGDVNRLSTDPQTRNYMQDNMGMNYIDPIVTRAAFVHALAQQEASGAMPDGVLLTEEAELKYINQIPHTDHSVWLPVCLQAYLDETNDYALLEELVVGVNAGEQQSVFDRITRAMHWLLETRDGRGLNYIAQGDWCDPMNMVGYKGKGVSGWLSIASAYAIGIWADICEQTGRSVIAQQMHNGVKSLKTAVQAHLWDGDWFARGITDDGACFGTSKDTFGRIFLNPQSWAILADIVEPEQCQKMLAAIDEQLTTPYGVAMLAPAFTSMRDDVGRVTQKFPGSAENGSVYNHAAIFYAFSLYKHGDVERAFSVIRKMLAGPDEQDYLRRGQLPVFIPNYYRGAYHQFPKTAGRSSQLFNTGTVSWLYRCIVEGLFGLRGDVNGLVIDPQFPADWQNAKATRRFRGALIELEFERRAGAKAVTASVDGVRLASPRIDDLESGKTYHVKVLLPMTGQER